MLPSVRGVLAKDRFEKRARLSATEQERDHWWQEYGRALAAINGFDYDPAKYQWGDAPDNGTCRACYEWRRYPPGQEHFGWSFRVTCDYDTCPHEHHLADVWGG